MASWEEPDPGEILPLGSDADWAALLARYPAFNPRPFSRCLEVARAGGATCVVIETRYIDLDYRSEYAAYYSRTFQEQPDSTHRLHFFSRLLAADEVWQFGGDPFEYLGYIVVRPLFVGRIGRTMLRPPPDVGPSIRTAVTDHVSFFGQNLQITAVPFVQQSTDLFRCAHAGAWVCHHSAYLRGDVGRREMADFSLAANAGLSVGRPLPSGGLTLFQISDVLCNFDLPPIHYNVRNLSDAQPHPWTPPIPTPPANDPSQHPGHWDTRIIAICCRYLNSGLPVLVCTVD